MLVIAIKPVEATGKTYQPGEVIAGLHPQTAKHLQEMGLVEIRSAPERPAKMRDKMVYTQYVRHGGFNS